MEERIVRFSLFRSRFELIRAARKQDERGESPREETGEKFWRMGEDNGREKKEDEGKKARGLFGAPDA